MAKGSLETTLKRTKGWQEGVSVNRRFKMEETLINLIGLYEKGTFLNR